MNFTIEPEFQVNNFEELKAILADGATSITATIKKEQFKCLEDYKTFFIYPLKTEPKNIKYFYVSRVENCYEDYLKRGICLDGIQIALERGWDFKYQDYDYQINKNVTPKTVEEIIHPVYEIKKRIGPEKRIEDRLCDKLEESGIIYQRQVVCQYGVIDVETIDSIYELKQCADISSVRKAIAQLFSYKASCPSRKDKKLVFVCDCIPPNIEEMLNIIGIETKTI